LSCLVELSCLAAFNEAGILTAATDSSYDVMFLISYFLFLHVQERATWKTLRNFLPARSIKQVVRHQRVIKIMMSGFSSLISFSFTCKSERHEKVYEIFLLASSNKQVVRHPRLIQIMMPCFSSPFLSCARASDMKQCYEIFFASSLN